jgi:hypothetical protein
MYNRPGARQALRAFFALSRKKIDHVANIQVFGGEEFAGDAPGGTVSQITWSYHCPFL